MNILWWIRKLSRGFKPFVANRIGEIQSLTNPQQWRHVSTKENPADLPTRGISVANLKNNALWWNGPEFLKCHEKNWPKVKIEVNQETLSEVRKHARIQIDTENEEDLTLLATTHETSWRLQPERYSSWSRLVRVRAWVQRFIENCTRKIEDRCRGRYYVSRDSGCRDCHNKGGTATSLQRRIQSIGKPETHSTKQQTFDIEASD